MKFDTTVLKEIAQALDHAANVAEALGKKHASVSEDGSAQKQFARQSRNIAWAENLRSAITELERRPARKIVEAGVPQSEGAQAIGRLFKRRENTPWSPKEITALRIVEAGGELNPENMTVIGLYYAAERVKGAQGVHRRDLCTFLNNFPGELDRARAFGRVAERDPRRRQAEEDPPRWDQFLSEHKFHPVPFDFAPSVRKDQFREWERAHGF